MSYIDFNSIVKKVNLKPGGEKEIVLEVPPSGLKGKLDHLSEMIGQKVKVSLDSLIVAYNITLNAQTNEPLTSYKVDERGVVSEVKREDEQQELDLGLPPANIPTKEEQEVLDRDVIDKFIISGLAPTYEDLAYNFHYIITLLQEGHTYLKIASELNMSSGKLVDVLSDYRKRIAPLAAKWWEWKLEQGHGAAGEDDSPATEGAEDQDSDDDNTEDGAA